MNSKNLLIITNNFPNANNSYVAEIFVKEQINYLKNYFQTVYVISPVAYGMERLRKNTYRNYHYDNVQVFFPKYFNLPFFYTHLRFIWVYLEINAVLRLIEREGIDFGLIHAHFTWPSGAVAVELKKYFNVPIVITEHTSITFRRSVEKKDKMFLNTWKKCDAIIRVSQRDISLFENIGISKNKVFYIPNGFNHSSFDQNDIFKCRKKLNLPENKKIILNVANLYSEVKGHKYLIKAIYEIVRYRKDILCIIVGGGKLEPDIRKQISDLGLEDYVKLVGSKSYDEIPTWMNACDVFVLPSLSESFGVVQIEAMACGKPVVATHNGGSEEIIVSNDYGLICDPARPKELAENILLSLDKNWDSEKIVSYVSQFSLPVVSKRILDIYDSVLSN